MRRLLGRLAIAGELLSFFWEARLWWMIPMVLLLLVLGGLIALGQSSAVAPLIYTLF
jgi:hypothetical protein